ncbi:hypothetical protein [Streptomyces sp. NPDC001744]|uniref:hypothetical protein n=1 Tax=Streptomyces sp. NPDC001744 TaxID=3364606 RepID=UPI0036A75E48
MTHPDDPAGDRSGRMSRSVVSGAASVAFWFCCPFWMLVWALALPLGLTGIALGAVEYRAASRQGVSRTQPLTGLALSSVGTAAAVAYMLFVFTRPDMPIQD